ncbi:MULTISPECIES: hypothetical protein [Yersinia]|uniref:Uncharacterized protein n=2 Tax=Yersinia TaxID=629 RepID=B7UF22_YERPU|nr:MULTISPECIES: hypothetical protein [Yersinia]MBO1551396.1 hypothetical protein [Yersinia pseudotuberculosis]MBO1562472.1 hypothetical protein [Yersinia pseudotuberculosis]MBO1571449.1 hypothetical protein [Yersinia pseudotuberculosis]MBO1586401.1 hypothetical protein [Yersinia pseudotuberculosis]MBO1631771.1 hypothetical protein [Yersinia pseudotuberculosis]
MTYSEEFKIALERTARFNLTPPDIFSETFTRVMNDKRIRQMNRVLAPAFEGILSYEQMVGQCLSINFKARPVLEEWLGCPVYYTLGWIDDGTQRGLYRFDDDMIADKLANGHQDDTMDIHAWLTLPSMEIIDLTLTTTLNFLQRRKEGEGGIIVKKADEITGLSYKPMLVGDTFLSKVGVLRGVTWFELG